jgi:hypothetical protein
MKRAKPIYRLRDGDQIPTRLATVREVMSDPKFALGVSDVRAGRGYPARYDAWEDTNDRWAYERGRQWARIAPRNLALKVNGELNPLALQQYGDGIL